MAKEPGFYFYTGDWQKDPGLRRCSKAAKGCWIDMLSILAECPVRGVFVDSGGVPWSDEEISNAIGGNTSENMRCIEELLRLQVASRNQAGAIYNRRMVRDQETKRANADRQNKFRQNGGGDPERWHIVRREILERDGKMCAYCGRSANTVDHIISKSKGGTEDSWNLVACCKRCNMEKTARTPDQAGMSFWAGFDKRKLTPKITPNVTPISEREVEREKEVDGFVVPDWIPRAEWDSFMEQRKKLRKSPTDKAKELLVKKLKALGGDTKAILEQSIVNGWQDVFPLREDRNGKGKRITADAYAPIAPTKPTCAWPGCDHPPCGGIYCSVEHRNLAESLLARQRGDTAKGGSYQGAAAEGGTQ